MSTYKVTYYETAYYEDIMIEADSVEEAEQIFYDKWNNDKEFATSVLLEHPVTVTDASLDIEEV